MGSTNDDLHRDLVLRIEEFVAKETGYSLARMNLDTLLVEDIGLDGDDFIELVQKFGEQFKVNLTNYRWYHHHGPEGCNPFWLIFRPWWMRTTHIHVAIRDLVEFASRGCWAFEYPEGEG